MEELICKATLKEWKPGSGLFIVPAYENEAGTISENLVQLSFKDGLAAALFCEAMEAHHAISA